MRFSLQNTNCVLEESQNAQDGDSERVYAPRKQMNGTKENDNSTSSSNARVKIKLRLNLQFRYSNGDLVPESIANYLTEGAEKEWTGQFGKYQTEAHFRDQNAAGVTVFAIIKTLAHEVGHALGARDRYNINTGGWNPGHYFDLMGTSSSNPKSHPLPATIQEILRFNGSNL